MPTAVRRDGRDLSIQLAAIVAGAAFSAVVLAGPLWIKQGLVNDREGLFSLFVDNLFSLNEFGEPAWWHPGVQLGFPQYYISILGWTALEPIYVLLCGLAWLTGQVGLRWHSYSAIYFAYSFFLIPLNLSLSLWVVARSLFVDRRVVYFVIALSMFSPGVVFGYSDSGIEVTPYGFYFLASVIHYARRPGRGSFLLMIGVLLLTMVSLNHIFLYWQIVLLGMIAVAVALQTLRRPAETSDALRQVSGWWWAAGTATALIAVAPCLITYFQGGEIVRSTTGTRVYDFWLLRPGNPLEMAAQSTPGVGFEWARYPDPASPFEIHLVDRKGTYMSYGYGGMLLLPLAWLGAIIGRRRWRASLQAVLVFGMAILVLSAYSPFLSPLFLIPSPFRAVNHYSDTALRLGFFALFLIGSAMGLESALRFRVVRRKLLPRAFAVSGLFSLALLVMLGGASVLSHYVFGLFAVLVFLYSIALHRLATARGRAALGTAFGLIVALSIVDTATMANQHLRLVLAPTAAGIKAAQTKSDFISGEFAGLRARRLLTLRGLDGGAIDQIRRQWPPLALLDAGGSDPQARVPGSTAITGATFNRLQVQVRTPVAARLLWRDANSPFWEARVDGRRVTIEEGVPHLKTVAVPAGDTTVDFRFRPARLLFSILLAYLVILLWFIAWAVFRYEGRRKAL